MCPCMFFHPLYYYFMLHLNLEGFHCTHSLLRLIVVSPFLCRCTVRPWSLIDEISSLCIQESNIRYKRMLWNAFEHKICLWCCWSGFGNGYHKMPIQSREGISLPSFLPRTTFNKTHLLIYTINQNVTNPTRKRSHLEEVWRWWWVEQTRPPSLLGLRSRKPRICLSSSISHSFPFLQHWHFIPNSLYSIPFSRHCLCPSFSNHQSEWKAAAQLSLGGLSQILGYMAMAERVQRRKCNTKMTMIMIIIIERWMMSNLPSPSFSTPPSIFLSRASKEWPPFHPNSNPTISSISIFLISFLGQERWSISMLSRRNLGKWWVVAT